MSVYVDGQRQPISEETNLTIDQALEPIRREAAGRDEAILGIACDGIDVSADDVTTVMERRVADCGRIDVQVGDPARLVGGALEDALSALDEAEVRRGEVITQLAQGRTSEGIKTLGDCLRHWYEINETIVRSVGLMGATGQPMDDEVAELLKPMETTRQRLTEIKEAVVAQDYVTLSDILEYEFDETGQAWRGVLEGLASLTKRGPVGGMGG